MFKYTENDINKIKYALTWSSRLTALVMLVFAEYVGGRFRLMGIIEEDPNYLCAYLAFGEMGKWRSKGRGARQPGKPGPMPFPDDAPAAGRGPSGRHSGGF